MKTTVSVRKATPEDIESIYRIISSYSEEGVLLSRSIEDINENLNNFLVAEMGGAIVGVVTFYDYGERLKEVRSLAVDKNQLRRGIGSALLNALISELNRANAPRIFVLTYAAGFFRKNRFSIIDMDTLPEKIWKDCANCPRQDSCNEVALEYTGA